MSAPTAGSSFSCYVTGVTNSPIEWKTAVDPLGDTILSGVLVPLGTSLRFESTELSNGNFNNFCYLEGTIATAGVYDWAFFLQDTPYTQSRSGTIEVVSSTPTPPSDPMPTLPPIAEGLVWTVGNSVDGLVIPGGTGGDAPLTNSIVEDLPDGVTVSQNSDGDLEFAGIPTTAQAAMIYTARVEDDDGDTDEETFTIEILPASVYIFDHLENTEGEFRTELQRLAITNLMTAFVASDGTLVAQARIAREGKSPVVTFDDDALIRGRTRSLKRSERAAPNSVRVWYNPRDLEEDVTLWSLASAVQVPADGEVVLGISFTDPESRTVSVAATDLDTQNLDATDDEDGSGTNVTSDIDAEIETSGPKWATLKLSNSGSDAAWVQAVEIAGTIYRSYERQYAEVRDEDDIAATGERRLEHTAPYLIGQDGAQGLADSLLAIYKGDRPEIRGVEQLVGTDDTDLVALDLGDIVTVEDSSTGYDHDCGIERIEWRVPPDGIPRLTFSLSVTNEPR